MYNSADSSFSPEILSDQWKHKLDSSVAATWLCLEFSLWVFTCVGLNKVFSLQNKLLIVLKAIEHQRSSDKLLPPLRIQRPVLPVI